MQKEWTKTQRETETTVKMKSFDNYGFMSIFLSNFIDNLSKTSWEKHVEYKYFLEHQKVKYDFCFIVKF